MPIQIELPYLFTPYIQGFSSWLHYTGATCHLLGYMYGWWHRPTWSSFLYDEGKPGLCLWDKCEEKISGSTITETIIIIKNFSDAVKPKSFVKYFLIVVFRYSQSERTGPRPKACCAWFQLWCSQFWLSTLWCLRLPPSTHPMAINVILQSPQWMG